MNKLILLLIICVTGCGKPLNKHKINATKQVVSPESNFVQTKSLEQFRLIEQKNYKIKNIETLLASIRVKAKPLPQDLNFENATTIYDFMPGTIYQIYTTPQKVTMISFEPGELMLSVPQSGDTVRWRFNSIMSGTNLNARQHLIIKPLREDLTNNMIITTNKGRVYLLELISLKNNYMLEVRWNYHDCDLSINPDQKAGETDASNLEVEAKKLNFNYKIINHKGKPLWKPIQVFDDGEKTMIEFSGSINQNELPALFIRSRESDLQLVNYRQIGNMLIVDRLFKEAELRLGLVDPEIVRIKRK